MHAHNFVFQFSPSDYARSVQFYKDWLGLELIRDWNRATDKGMLLSAGHEAVVELVNPPDGQSNASPDIHKDAPSALRTASVAEELSTGSAAALSSTPIPKPGNVHSLLRSPGAVRSDAAIAVSVGTTSAAGLVESQPNNIRASVPGRSPW